MFIVQRLFQITDAALYLLKEMPNLQVAQTNAGHTIVGN